MSDATREINRITSAVIHVSIKLILLALVILLLYEAVTRGYAFGHEVFYAEAVDEPPGRDITVEISEGDTAAGAADLLADQGLIENKYAFIIQSIFYDLQDIQPGTYTLNTSMTSKEILQALNTENETPQDQPQTAASTAAPRIQTESASESREEAEAETYPDEESEDGGWIQDITEGEMP